LRASVPTERIVERALARLAQIKRGAR